MSQAQAIKCVVVGESGVGKSQIVHRLIGSNFRQEHTHTLGVDVLIGDVDKKIIQFWDCAGKEEFSGMADGYYIGANIGLVVFDLGNCETYRKAYEWAYQLNRVAPEAKILLIGNKSDKPTRVNRKDVHMPRHLGYVVGYRQVSARDNVGIVEAMRDIMREIN